MTLDKPARPVTDRNQGWGRGAAPVHTGSCDSKSSPEPKSRPRPPCAPTPCLPEVTGAAWRGTSGRKWPPRLGVRMRAPGIGWLPHWAKHREKEPAPILLVHERPGPSLKVHREVAHGRRGGVSSSPPGGARPVLWVGSERPSGPQSWGGGGPGAGSLSHWGAAQQAVLTSHPGGLDARSVSENRFSAPLSAGWGVGQQPRSRLGHVEGQAPLPLLTWLVRV